MLCMGIAFAFWLLTKLSNQYRTRISIAIDYQLPDGEIFSQPPPTACDVDLLASGWELISMRQRRITITGKEIALGGSLQEKSIQDKIKNALNTPAQIYQVVPQQIALQTERLQRKTVPLRADVQVACAAQYRLWGKPSLNISEVQLSGPQSLLDTIEFWSTEALAYPELDHSVRSIIALRSHPNSQVSISPSSAELSINVQQATEKQLALPVQIRSARADSNLIVALLPQSVTLTCVVGLKDFARLQASDFEAYIDLPSTYTSSADGSQQLPVRVQLRNPATQADVLRIQPASVRFLVRKINQ